MAISVHDYEGTISITAPAGGTTQNAFSFSSTNKSLVLALATATSGTANVPVLGPLSRKRLSGVTKKTGAAWTIFQKLTYNTTSGFFNATTGAIVYASALATATAGATTGDVMLTPPAIG